MITIRRVNGATFKWLLHHMQLEILPGTKPADTEVGAWWIAFDGLTPVAFAASTASRQWSDAGYMSRCGVVESHRGRGLQKRLLKVREKHARKQGMNWAVSDTRDNLPSANNLIASGYRLYAPGKPWSYRGALYWRKKLRTA